MGTRYGAQVKQITQVSRCVRAASRVYPKRVSYLGQADFTFRVASLANIPLFSFPNQVLVDYMLTAVPGWSQRDCASFRPLFLLGSCSFAKLVSIQLDLSKY